MLNYTLKVEINAANIEIKMYNNLKQMDETITFKHVSITNF